MKVFTTVALAHAFESGEEVHVSLERLSFEDVKIDIDKQQIEHPVPGGPLLAKIRKEGYQ